MVAPRPTDAPTAGTPRHRTLLVLALMLVLVVACAVLIGTGDGTRRPGATQSDSEVTTPPNTSTPAPGSTVFRTASFNLLGAGHTPPRGPLKKYASGEERLRASVKLIENLDLEVVGFQEMHRPQYQEFRRIRDDATYGLYPGTRFAEAAIHNSLIWRKDRWRAVRKETVSIPYFGGSPVRMPYVLLENRGTRQQVWFANFHNPANTHGDASKWRRKATDLQIALVNRLRTETPGTPVIFTGDFNDRELYFCPVTKATELRSAGGGANDARGCVLNRPQPVDWLFGTTDVQFTGYEALRDRRVEKLTDHPVVLATANIAPANATASNARRALVVVVDGLGGATVQHNLSRLPILRQLRDNGSSTLQARTLENLTNPLRNATAVLTGRSLPGSAGNGRTLPQSGAGYAPSLFDLVHDDGGSTLMAGTRPTSGALAANWDGRVAPMDRVWRDDGRSKVDAVVTARTTRELVTRLVDRKRKDRLAVAHLSVRPYRGGPAKHADRLVELDRQIGRLWRSSKKRVTAQGRPNDLVLVVVGSNGWSRKGSASTIAANRRVALFVHGPGVARGADLYRVNPSLAQPGTRAGQPWRTGDVANLVTRALRLPAVPGSQFNSRQTLVTALP